LVEVLVAVERIDLDFPVIHCLIGHTEKANPSKAKAKGNRQKGKRQKKGRSL
jgi:hypothetical protein